MHVPIGVQYVIQKTAGVGCFQLHLLCRVCEMCSPPDGDAVIDLTLTFVCALFAVRHADVAGDPCGA